MGSRAGSPAAGRLATAAAAGRSGSWGFSGLDSLRFFSRASFSFTSSSSTVRPRFSARFASASALRPPMLVRDARPAWTLGICLSRGVIEDRCAVTFRLGDALAKRAEKRVRSGISDTQRAEKAALNECAA